MKFLLDCGSPLERFLLHECSFLMSHECAGALEYLIHGGLGHALRQIHPLLLLSLEDIHVVIALMLRSMSRQVILVHHRLVAY